MRYHEIRNHILVEAFAPPVKWKWTEKKQMEWVAQFQIKPVVYTASCFLYMRPKDLWEFSFSAKTKKQDFGYEPSGTGNAFTVFGTIVDIAATFLRTKRPAGIKIESDSTHRSRASVNARIANAIADLSSDYRLVDLGQEETIYIIRDDIAADYLDG